MKLTKRNIAKLLEGEKWYPWKATNLEMETSKLLNKILDNIKKEINERFNN